jgi:biopolymer transport protein ExbB/TolQ
VKSFWRGFIAGAVVMLLLVFVVLVVFVLARDKNYQVMEVQNEIQELREDYSNRDAVEFLDVPGVRGAADSNIEQFRKKRDEILQRYGSEGTD